MMRAPSLALALLTAVLAHAQVVITASGPFVVPAGVTQITVELIGAGGNGASNGGGGGGGGGYVRGTVNVTPGQSIPIVVGAGGSEMASIAGGQGLIANAGANATTVPNPNLGGGGTGGSSLGGQVNRFGGTGGGGYWTYFGGGGGGAAGSVSNGTNGGNTIVWNGANCLTPGGAGGAGGGGMAGSGGKGAGFTDNNCTVTDPAGNGGNYGAGGGGGNGIGSPVGIGGGGVCIITWNGMMGVETMSDATLDVSTVFEDRITIRDASRASRYQLFDGAGRSIWSGARIEQEDFSRLTAGQYVLIASDGRAVSRHRLMKLPAR